MNFGDDPLADLSDGSNDSFFEEPKLAKRSSLTKTPEKKSITDIFNISDKPQETSVSKRSDDWLGLETKEAKSPARTPKIAKKISFEDDDDILGNLGLSKKPSSSKPETATHETKPGKKLDLLESILGPSKTEETEKKTSFDDILKESRSKSSVSSKSDDFDKKRSDDLFRDSKSPGSKSESLLLSDGPREGRRGRRSSTGLMDPLGLFSSEPKQDPEQDKPESATKAVQSKSTPNISSSDKGLPDWLGGTPIKQSKSENVLSKETEHVTEVVKDPKPTEMPTPVKSEETQPALTSVLAQQKLAQANLEYQNTSIALQQQESQLLMALQLKKYEENMSEIQLKQQEVLMKQEEQFNLLLERQFAKQQIMENNMRLQQERINSHIQMLIAQPPITRHTSNTDLKSENEENEKLYEHIINSLKQRQQEEIFLMEESYKKQISLLEQSLDSVEKRLKFDVDKVSEIFEDKLKSFQQQHDEEIHKYKQKIQEMELQHSNEIKQVRENSNRLIDEIKYEHSTLLENIKEAKKSESSLFQESATYLQKLDSNIEVLYANSKSLVDLRDHVEKDYGILSKAREESLKAKEQEIIAMRVTLEKCRESAEQERAELLALVRTLETKIAEQNQNAREERWAFQQAASTLAARSAAMDREAEFNRASLEREREQLKTLRESILAEHEKMIQQLHEEKLQISAEKSRLETSTKLSSSYDAQKAKTEIEAALQVAKEAADMTDREREELHREKCEVEKLKRQLKDQERKLSLRQNEIESLMRAAEMKKTEGEKAVSESKIIETKYNERLRDLQSQLLMLSNREKRLAEEKIVLSRERLALNNLIKQNKKCGLCSADPQKLEENEVNLNQINLISPYYSRFDQIDEDIIRLRLEADEEPRMEENVPK